MLKDLHTKCDFPKWFSTPFQHYFIMLKEKEKLENKIKNL
jgi:hypothetical protein